MHTTVQKPEIHIIGIACKTSNAPTDGPVDIPKLWQRFYGEGILHKIPNKASQEVIALYCDYEGDHTAPYSIVIGCPVISTDTIPEGMHAKTILGGTFARFQAIGEHPASLIATWGAIWQSKIARTY